MIFLKREYLLVPRLTCWYTSESGSKIKYLNYHGTVKFQET